jgi:hypothetical protein
MAARATFDLNTGVWFRRGRLLIVSPVRGHHRRYQAETPLIPLSRFAEPALCLVIPNTFNLYSMLKQIKDLHLDLITLTVLKTWQLGSFSDSIDSMDRS